MSTPIRSAKAGTAQSGDALVEVSPGAGTSVRVQSPVLDLLGDDIRAVTVEVLGCYGVDGVTVSVQDNVASPWVLKARITTALRRSGLAILEDPS